jgi:hypothetical protein
MRCFPAILKVLLVWALSLIPSQSRTEELAEFFRPPQEYEGEFGDYRSPLKFYDGREVKSPEDWQSRRQEILRRWHTIMGPWPPLIDSPKIEYVKTERREDFTQHRIRLEVATDRMHSAILLVPDGDGPFPAAVVPYYEPETGAGLGKELRDFGYQLTKRGFVTLSIGGCEPRRDRNEEATIQRLTYEAYVAANCHSALANLPNVDAQRIGIVGHSYGGKWAMFASCLFERFACAAWSDGGIVFDEKRANVNYWEPWYLGYESGKPPRQKGIPTPDKPRTGAYKTLVEQGLDLHELHALMAPRPFLVSGGAEDQLERWKALNHAIAVNNFLGNQNRVAMTNRPSHEPTTESNGQIYEFLERFLKVGPLRVHPTNPRYFTNGAQGPDGALKAVYLTGSHTWNTLQDLGMTDPPQEFDFNGYLDFLEKHHHNFIRLWRWELTEWTQWKESKPPVRYGAQHPWKRTGPGLALDGRPKFDLRQWDDTHFQRLRARVQAAQERGIYVSIMLFEGCMLREKPSSWAGHPMNAANNASGINGDPDADGLGLEVQMFQVPAITETQKAYIRKVVDVVNDFDNVLYEISNESLFRPEILNWQNEMIRYINEYQAGKPQQHPVGMTSLVGFNAREKSDSHAALYASAAAWVSPGMPIYGPKDPYSVNPPASKGDKIEILDTDHTWNNACMAKSGPHQLDRADRVWVWKSFLRGYNPIYMDPLDLSRPNAMMDYVEYCTAAVLSARAAMGHTREFASKMNLAAMKPSDAWASSGYCLADPGHEYLVYQPESQTPFTVTLQAGEYRFDWFNPSLGKTTESGSLTVATGEDRSFTAPFSGDAVLYITNSKPRREALKQH